MIHLGRGLYTSDMDFLFCYRGVQKNGRFTLKLAYLGHELQILLPRCVMDMTFTGNVVYEIAVFVYHQVKNLTDLHGIPTRCYINQ